jgi:hypothetical protein
MAAPGKVVSRTEILEQGCSRHPYFEPFSVSLPPLFLTHPNHARFGTDVKPS